MHSYDDDMLTLRRTGGERASDRVRGVRVSDRNVSNVQGGRPLDPLHRLQMERAIGADFSSVRIHTGGEADASAKQLSAHAYTVGNDVVFADGQYDPDSTSGQRTLAHELTHVVQQRSGPVDGTDTGGGVRVSDPSDRYERGAEAMAEQVVDGGLFNEHVAGSEPSNASAAQRNADGESVRSPAAQLENDEDEAVQTLAVQGEEEAEEEEPLQALAVQREEEEEEPIQALAVRR
jgi:Domain of unknown function (DUF4157)